MKKSIFSKIFLFNIGIVTVVMIGFAALQYTLVSNYIYKESVKDLKNNANSVARFIGSGVPVEVLDNFLYGFSKSTGKNVLIVDGNRNIIMSAANEDEFNKGTKMIDISHCQKVLSGGEDFEVGTLGGVYNKSMFTLKMPIFANKNPKAVGAIFISMAADEDRHMRLQISKMTLFSFIPLVLLSLIFSIIISRGISGPIKKISKAVKRFAKGDFSSRVEIGEKGYNITEVNELANTFNDMAFSIEQADKMRSSFVADVSHELRTPMTSISGFVDGILDDTIPRERHKEYLMIVKEEITRLSALVNSFLALTRLKNNSLLEMVDFDINEQIRHVFIGFESRLDEKEIDVEIEFESEVCYVKAVEDSIKQVLMNLIDNAIKFTDPKGKIVVKVFTKHNEVFVSVMNTGCGIAEGELKFIFERFYKIDRSRSINPEGTGIGLYIVKDIINNHGKEIKVESREGEYALFTFSLDKGKNRDN